jgi:hypothetical protein
MKAKVVLICDDFDCVNHNECTINNISGSIYPIIEGNIKGSSFRYDNIDPSAAEELLESKLNSITCLSYKTKEE